MRIENRLTTRCGELIAELPVKAAGGEMIEEMRFRKSVEDGIAQADRGEFAEPSEARAAFAKWGVKLEAC